MATMKKPMVKKSMAKKSAPMMMSGSMMKEGGKVMKAQKGVTKSMKNPNYSDSAKVYGKKFDDYNAEAVNAMGTSKASGLRKKAAEARKKEVEFSKKAYGTTPGLPQKNGSVTKAKNGMHKMPGGKMMKNSSMKKGGKMSKKAC
jgi:hypothetical protein